MSRARKDVAVPGRFTDRASAYTDRIGDCLDRALPGADVTPERLHEAMRYAVLSGGKRLRPLLVYATGESLGIDPARLDIPATAIELIHAFSLVHDDLPAMDDDDLRRGQPTVHCKYDEATAILAADALQPLAFGCIANADVLTDAEKSALVATVAEACGSQGMTGGQSIDLASEGRQLSAAELEEMHSLKTGALIRAAVMTAACLAPGLGKEEHEALDRFAQAIGLAFQIRDDILDVLGETDVLGKRAGADERMAKATWPALFGLEEARAHCQRLLAQANTELEPFGDAALPLRSLAEYVVERAY